MGSFLQNNRAYNIKSETGLARILTYFDSTYVMGIMDDNLRNADIQFSALPKPNIVNSFEDNFKAILIEYPEEKDQIMATRESVYYEIIAKLSNHFSFEFKPSVDMDIYAITYLLYDFYVANYNPYLIKLLTEYIIKEQDAIYISYNLDQFRKDKDVSTITNKSLFESSHMAIICSHIDYVLNNITGIDFPIENILNVIYNYNQTQVNAILQHISPKFDLFKVYYTRLFNNPDTKVDIITAIKWELMKRCSNGSINLDY